MGQKGHMRWGTGRSMDPRLRGGLREGRVPPYSRHRSEMGPRMASPSGVTRGEKAGTIPASYAPNIRGFGLSVRGLR